MVSHAPSRHRIARPLEQESSQPFLFSDPYHFDQHHHLPLSHHSNLSHSNLRQTPTTSTNYSITTPSTDYTSTNCTSTTTRPSSSSPPQPSSSSSSSSSSSQPHIPRSLMLSTPDSTSYLYNDFASNPPTKTNTNTNNTANLTGWGMQFQEYGLNNAQGGLSPAPQQKHSSNPVNPRSSGGHQRNYSESTINSAGPPSPFASSFSTPLIAGSGHSSPSHQQLRYEQALRNISCSHSQYDYLNSYPQESQPSDYEFTTIGYTPSQLSHTPSVHLDMAHMAMDQHNAPADDMPDFSSSSRQSLSSRGQDSPSTPHTDKPTAASTVNDDVCEERPGLYKMNTNGMRQETGPDLMDAYLFLDQTTDYRQTAPRVELFRTESAAAADELYNPDFSQPQQSSSTTATSHLQPNASSDKTANSGYLSPCRNLVQDRIRTANNARSQSPQQTTTRAKSPFRPGSPLAPTIDGGNQDAFKSPTSFFTSAADARRKQIEEASAREMDRHKQPQLQREPTKTMSPRDAVLDYEMDSNADMPLFPDALPQGYEKHVGPSEFFSTNFINSSNPSDAVNQAYVDSILANQGQQTPTLGAFRPQSVTINSKSPASMPLAPPQQQQQSKQPQQQQQQATVPTQPQNNSFAAPHYRSTNFSDKTPDFPAHLTSMESSISDAPISSQTSITSDPTIQRPQDTSAATGGYTCTFHNCVQRFDSPAKLQKHKREFHRNQRDLSAQIPSTHASGPASGTTSAAASVSPDPSRDGSSDGSVASVGSGMTSAALAARNSQAGPHKCTRINPSTGKPCNTVFSRPYDLTRHEDTIHNRQKVKVRCEYCREEKTFSRNDALTRHMRVVHPEIPWEVKRGRGGRAESAY